MFCELRLQSVQIGRDLHRKLKINQGVGNEA